MLVGLPGDMESENTYRDETRHLLQLLQRPDLAPKNVFLLTGLTPAAPEEPDAAVTLLPNDRGTFLSLTDRLKHAAMPCTFVVFGHGGMQGNDSVFHVPGPRLKPDDFLAVANAVPSSAWLLFFPGSGNFAHLLQAPGRTLLTSEAGDQVFTEDPLSFGFFLAALEKESDLGRLATLTGAATYRWYDSRSLAATEDPALWLGLQPPRKLAKAAPQEVEQAGTSVAGASDAANGSTNGPPQPLPPPPLAGPDPDWQAITPVAPEKYPKCDAVVLSRHVSYLIDDNDGVTEDEDTFLQILTSEGKRHGDLQFSFSPPNEDLTFLACEVRLPDGTIQRLDPDQIHDAVRAEPDDYDVERRKIFSFPQIEPGAIMRVHLQRAWRHFPLPHVFEEIPLATDNPVVALQVQVSVPRTMAFHFKLLHRPPADPAITTTTYGSVYTWQFRDVPAVLDEPLGPPEQQPMLAVTTFPDWASFSDWYIRLIRESNQPTPELTKQAQTLVEGAKSDEEKIERTARFVTNFRYVSVPLGVNSFRPHSALHVWENRYGDCKDKANLLCTLLTVEGFKTHLVLVPRFSQAYADLPGFAFNHAIAAVELGGKTRWIDTTDDVCRFGLLPPGDAGRNVLVIDDQIKSLTALPETKAEDHRVTLDTDVQLADDATRDAEVKIRAQTAGYGDYLLRAADEAEGTHSLLPLLERPFDPSPGLFTFQSQSSTTVDDLSSPFTWSAKGSWTGLVGQLPKSPTRLVRLPAWLPREWSLAMLPRSSPLHLNEGYPMQIVQSWHLHLPPHASQVQLPAPQSDAGPQLAWKLTWSQATPGEITARLDLTLAQADLDIEQTRAFQTSCHHLLEILQDGLTYQDP